MEPAKASIRYSIVAFLTKKFQEGGNWFVHFDGSWESLSVGSEEPPWSVGDRILITFERVRNG